MEVTKITFEKGHLDKPTQKIHNWKNLVEKFQPSESTNFSTRFWNGFWGLKHKKGPSWTHDMQRVGAGKKKPGGSQMTAKKMTSQGVLRNSRFFFLPPASGEPAEFPLDLLCLGASEVVRGRVAWATVKKNPGAPETFHYSSFCEGNLSKNLHGIHCEGNREGFKGSLLTN